MPYRHTTAAKIAHTATRIVIVDSWQGYGVKWLYRRVRGLKIDLRFLWYYFLVLIRVKYSDISAKTTRIAISTAAARETYTGLKIGIIKKL